MKEQNVCQLMKMSGMFERKCTQERDDESGNLNEDDKCVCLLRLEIRGHRKLEATFKMADTPQD